MTLSAEPITLAHRARLEPLLAARWPHRGGEIETALSDPWFANLFLFREAHDWRFTDGAYPRITGRAYDGTRLVLPLFELASAPRAEWGALLGGADAFGPFSEAQAAALAQAGFELSFERDESDYLYPAENFVLLRGRVLNKKRNQLRQLVAAHGEPHTEPYKAARAGEALAVLDAWLADKGKGRGEADDAPCREALALAPALGLGGLIFRIGGVPVGFVLAEVIRPGVHVMRFAKALDRYVGLYPFMFQQYCRLMPEVRWINFEQDLGQPGFRQAKMAYRPAALLHKYRARPR